MTLTETIAHWPPSPRAINLTPRRRRVLQSVFDAGGVRENWMSAPDAFPTLDVLTKCIWAGWLVDEMIEGSERKLKRGNGTAYRVRWLITDKGREALAAAK